MTSEHTTQHGQTLNITHLTVVFKPVEEGDSQSSCEFEDTFIN